MAGYELNGAASHVVNYACLIAALRRSVTLDVSDLFAGLYIVDAENLSNYWKDRRALDQLALTASGVQEYVLLDRAGGFESAIQREGGRLDAYFANYSPPMVNIMNTAVEYARSRGGERPVGKPLLIPEDFLLALANHTEVDLGKKLIESGLDMERLKRATKTHGG